MWNRNGMLVVGSQVAPGAPDSKHDPGPRDGCGVVLVSRNPPAAYACPLSPVQRLSFVPALCQPVQPRSLTVSSAGETRPSGRRLLARSMAVAQTGRPSRPMQQPPLTISSLCPARSHVQRSTRNPHLRPRRHVRPTTITRDPATVRDSEPDQLRITTSGAVYALILSQPELAAACRVHVVARSNLKHIQSDGLEVKSVKFGDVKGLKFAGGQFAPAALRGCPCSRAALCLSPAYGSTAEAHEAVPKFDFIICKSRLRLVDRRVRAD